VDSWILAKTGSERFVALSFTGNTSLYKQRAMCSAGALLGYALEHAHPPAHFRRRQHHNVSRDFSVIC